MKIIGKCSGLAAASHVHSSSRRIFQPGCFSPVPQAVPLLFSHGRKIGAARCRETSAGVEVEGEFTIDTDRDADIFRLLQNGELQDFSVGYEPIESHKDGGVGPELVRRAALLEVTLTPDGGNPAARVSAISWRPLTFEEILKGEN